MQDQARFSTLGESVPRPITTSPAPFCLFDQPKPKGQQPKLENRPGVDMPRRPTTERCYGPWAMGHGMGLCQSCSRVKTKSTPEGVRYDCSWIAKWDFRDRGMKDPDLWVRNVQMNRQANIHDPTDRLFAPTTLGSRRATRDTLSPPLVLRRDTALYHLLALFRGPFTDLPQSARTAMNAPHHTAPHRTRTQQGILYP